MLHHESNSELSTDEDESKQYNEDWREDKEEFAID